MPRIFGMTASPTGECIEVLRSEFYVCKTEHTAGFAALAKVVVFPVDRHPLPLNVREQILNLLAAIKGCGILNKESLEKISEDRFKEMYDALGSWCTLSYLKLTTEYYGEQFVPAYSEDVKQHTVLSQLVSRMETMLEKIEEAEAKEPEPAGGNAQGLLSGGRRVERLEALVKLLKPFENDSTFRCLVFVERRSASRVVSEYLRNRIDLPVGFIVGQADSGSLIAHKAARFQDTLHKFREGDTQVLVTTNVSSEGIDVPQCNLVIALDPLKNPREFLHTRGRARHEQGVFMYMINRNDPEELEQFKNLFSQAENIRRLDFSGDKKTAEHTLRSKYPRNVLKVESTGAELDMDSSTSVLIQFYQSLGYDLMPAYLFQPVAVPKCRGRSIHYPALLPALPECSDEPIASRSCWYTCELSLPNFLGIEAVRTPTFRNKVEARAAAAYMACRRLYEKEFLDEYLFPKKEKGEGRINLNEFEHFDKDLPRNITEIALPRPKPEYMGLKGFQEKVSDMEDGEVPTVPLYIYTYHRYTDQFPEMKPLAIAYTKELPASTLHNLNVWSAQITDSPAYPLVLQGPRLSAVPKDTIESLLAFHIRLCSIAIDRKNSPYLEKIDGLPEGFEDKGYMFVPVQKEESGEYDICWEDVQRYITEPWETSQSMWPLPEHNPACPNWLIEMKQGKVPYIFEVEGYTEFTTGDIKRKYELNRDKEGSEQWDHLMFEDADTGQPYQVASGYTWFDFGKEDVPEDTPLLRCRRLPLKLAYDTVTCTLRGRRRKKKAVKGLDDDSDDSDDESVHSGDEGDGKTKKVKKPKDSIYQEWLRKECYFTEEKLDVKTENKDEALPSEQTDQAEPATEATPMDLVADKPKAIKQEGPISTKRKDKVGSKKGSKTPTSNKPKDKVDYKEVSKKTMQKLQPIWKRKPADVDENGNVKDEENGAEVGSKREAEELENDEEHERWKRARRVLLRNLIIPRCHRFMLYPASMLFSAMELMPVLYQIERRLQALELRRRIGDETIPSELVEESSTKPFYERLESLGDSYVGFVMAWYVFQLEPMILDEGSLSDFRTNLVQNLRFLKCALDEKQDLPRFMGNHKQVRNESFEYWDPSCSTKLAKQCTVKEKVPADVVEAMIGAYLIGGGDVSANTFLNWCGLPTVPNLYSVDRTPLLEGHFPISHLLRLRHSAFAKPAFREFYGPDGDGPKFSKVHQLNKFEKRLGYCFENKWLLLRAWTHPSFSHKYWESCNGEYVKIYDYQRLEFLGDSVIGYLVVSHFFMKWKNCGPHDLTMVKALHVSNWKLAVIAKKDLELHKFMLYDSTAALQSIVNFDFNREDTTPKILADSFEALIGAVFLDSKGDMELVHRVCWKWIEAAGRVGKERTETAKLFEEYKEGKDLTNIPSEALPSNLLSALESTEMMCLS